MLSYPLLFFIDWSKIGCVWKALSLNFKVFTLFHHFLNWNQLLLFHRSVNSSISGGQILSLTLCYCLTQIPVTRILLLNFFKWQLHPLTRRCHHCQLNLHVFKKMSSLLCRNVWSSLMEPNISISNWWESQIWLHSKPLEPCWNCEQCNLARENWLTANARTNRHFKLSINIGQTKDLVTVMHCTDNCLNEKHNSRFSSNVDQKTLNLQN